MIDREPNVYSMNEVLLIEALQDDKGVWHPAAYAIIEHRKFINGKEVAENGTPKHRNDPW